MGYGLQWSEWVPRLVATAVVAECEVMLTQCFEGGHAPPGAVHSGHAWGVRVGNVSVFTGNTLGYMG